MLIEYTLDRWLYCKICPIMIYYIIMLYMLNFIYPRSIDFVVHNGLNGKD